MTTDLNSDTPTPLSVGNAVAALAQAREAVAPQAVFVATMSAQFALDQLKVSERRVDSVPLMGGAAGIGLGLALARPDLPVVVIDGDASLALELGGLLTVAHNKPRHLVHIVINNGVQFNGLTNLPTTASEPGADFAGMARCAGYTRSLSFNSLQAWAAALPELLTQAGTTFVNLAVQPQPAQIGASRPQPILPDYQFVRMRLGVQRLKQELAA